jgi:hypothetical protein
MKYLFNSRKRNLERRGKTLLASNSLKACFVSFYRDCLPGVVLRVEVARGNNEFGWRTAVRTLLVHVRKRKFIGDALLSAPVPNAL